MLARDTRRRASGPRRIQSSQDDLEAKDVRWWADWTYGVVFKRKFADHYEDPCKCFGRTILGEVPPEFLRQHLTAVQRRQRRVVGQAVLIR